MSLRLHAGPVEKPAQCDHGGPTLPTDPDDLDLITGCEAEAAVTVPWPDFHVLGTVTLCSWHLARMLDAFPEFEPTLREAFAEEAHDLDEYLPDPVFVNLEDVPETVENDQLPELVQNLDREWTRVGLDQHGFAHYRDADAAMVIVVDAALAVAQVQALDRRSLEDWLEFIRLERGWAALDGERVEYYGGELA